MLQGFKYQFNFEIFQNFNTRYKLITKTMSKISQESFESEDLNVVEAAENPVKSQIGIGQRFLNFIKDLRGELIIMFFALSYFIITVFLHPFVWYQVCIHNYPGENFCTNHSAVEQATEAAIQTETAYVIFVHMLIKILPSIFLLIFWGPWSDKHGRLFPTLTPMIGIIISTIIFILINEFPTWPIYVIYIAAVPAGITGFYSCFMMGFFAWINDAHSKAILSTKIATVNGVETLMIVIVPYLGRGILTHAGYTSLFVTGLAFMTISCVFVIIFISNTDKKYLPAPFMQQVLDMVNCKEMITTFKTLSVVRPYNGRVHYVLMLCSILPIAMCFFGHHQINFLYLRYVANFSVPMFTDYSCVQGVCDAIGFLILAPILISLAKMTEPLLGILSNLGFIAFYLTTAFLTSVVALFLVCLFQIIGIISLMTTRSFISKVVEPGEIGRAMSLVGVCQAVGRNVGEVVSSILYGQTLTYFPGAFYIMAGCFLFISVAINIFILIDLKRIYKSHPKKRES